MTQHTEDRGLSSAALHILAMGCMLCDHLGVFFPRSVWLPCVGRLAFPIFAFLIAEGIRYTSDKGRYMKRLLLLAVLSEIPFDLQYERSVVYPFHQNVIWTFLIALLALIPIWLYRGRQGCHTREFRWFCYTFYPAHMLLLYLPVCFL